jgi:hypothetical protein
MQILHSSEVHFLHPGALDADFTCWPGRSFCLLARMRFLHLPQDAEIAFRQCADSASWPAGGFCIQARMQFLHAGVLTENVPVLK